jgi:hypothetical protein
MSFTAEELFETVEPAIQVFINTFRATVIEYDNAIARETNETRRIGLMFSKGDALDRAMESAEILASDTVYRTARAVGLSESVAAAEARRAKNALNSKLVSFSF